MMQPEQDFKLHTSPTVRWGLFISGWIFLLLGILGVFLPLLPTTPFVLLSAGCFARSSEKFYRYLLHHKIFGPLINNWRLKRCISLKNKRYALGIIGITFGLSLFIVRERIYLVIMLVALMLLLSLFLIRIKNCQPDQ